MSNAKNALITGASRGLGRALARRLAERGWQLIVDARGKEALQKTVTELAERTEVIAISGDVTDPEHRADLAEAANHLGGLDALVNNASFLGPSPQPRLSDYPLDVFERVYDTNVTAPLALVQTLADAFRDGPRIVNVSSDAAVAAYPGWGGYGSSKAALDHLAAILAEEHSDWRVYAVDPGDMRTEMHRAAFPGEDLDHLCPPSVSAPGIVVLLEGDFDSGRYLARNPEDHHEPGLAKLQTEQRVEHLDITAHIGGAQ